MFAYEAHHATRNLVHAFVAWKSLLLIIAIGSGVGPAYDTSSTLIPPHVASASASESAFDLATKLTRWDAIYFVQAARRGYVFEQEWAFGGALPAVIATIAKAATAVGVGDHGSREALIAICVAHASHLLSVLALYQLGISIGQKPRLSFVAALLHILSPAGLFLSAPYNESPFALCSFLGFLLFAEGIRKAGSTAGDLLVLASGAACGLATTFRSNGLLSGIPFAVFALRELAGFVTAPTVARMRRLVALGVGGIFIALGLIGPQAVAYQKFCSGASAGDELRTWCTRRVPSIYTFVQERYWNVGFLRYWTPGNIPLFLLAAPMLYVMLKSGFGVFTNPLPLGAAGKESGPTRTPSDMSVFVRSMAASQVILTSLAITNYHVQIITRISSGYPVWYWWVAQGLAEAEGKRSKFARGVVVFMVMYASIQGALFASFLPPA